MSTSFRMFLTILLITLSYSSIYGQGVKKFPDYVKSTIVTADSIYKLDDFSVMKSRFFDAGIKSEAEGNIEETTKYFLSYLNSFSNYFYQYLIMIDDEKRNEIWNEHKIYIKHIQNFAIANNPQYEYLGSLAYECELLSKSLLLTSSNTVRNAVLNSGDSTLLEMWTDLSTLKEGYSIYKTYIGIAEIDSTYIAAKEAVNQGLDHILSKEIEEIKQLDANFEILQKMIVEGDRIIGIFIKDFYPELVDWESKTWKDIYSTLRGAQASIEFVAHSGPDCADEDILYSALLIRSKYNCVKAIPLTDSKTLLNALNKNDLDELYKLVWLPLEEYLDGINQIFISTSGLISTVPFAGLKIGRRYVTDYYLIHNFLSTRDILKMGHILGAESFAHKKALLFGGIDFDLSSGELLQQNDSLGNLNASNLIYNELDQLNFYRGQGVDYLPGTKKEVMVADSILKSHRWISNVYTDELASKDNLKIAVLDSLTSILHISTHGYYFSPPKKIIYDMKMSDIGSVENAAFKLSDNPLMRSGLLFAGANHIWSGKEAPKSFDEGILTALEISNLNLSSVKLVILSACKTGLGDIDYSEGIYGIPRALRLAGAGAILVSLYDIPDRETAEFMQVFYKGIVEYNWINYAFRKAMDYMRDNYPNNPEIWTAFVLIE